MNLTFELRNSLEARKAGKSKEKGGEEKINMKESDVLLMRE